MLVILVQLAFCVITGLLARRKHYNFFAWFFAAGAIGLIILAFLPFAETPRQRTIGNRIGVAIPLSFIALLAIAIVWRSFNR
jgi:hypothetical protein